MKLLDYQKAAQRTCKDMGSEAKNIAHMALGFASELSEFEECIFGKPRNLVDLVNLSEELGDKMWYAVNYATFRGIDLSTFMCENHNLFKSHRNPDLEPWHLYDIAIHELPLEGGRMADFAKRLFIYGQKIEDQKNYPNEATILFDYMYSVYIIATEHRLNFEEIMGRNIVKLYTRYPDKFSDDKALTRDLEAERLALEGKINE